MHGDCGQERGKLIQVAPYSLMRLPWSELPEIHGVAWLLSRLVTSVILDHQHLQEMFVSVWERKWIYISHVLLRGPPCTCDKSWQGKMSRLLCLGVAFRNNWLRITSESTSADFWEVLPPEDPAECPSLSMAPDSCFLSFMCFSLPSWFEFLLVQKLLPALD